MGRGRPRKKWETLLIAFRISAILLIMFFKISETPLKPTGILAAIPLKLTALLVLISNSKITKIELVQAKIGLIVLRRLPEWDNPRRKIWRGTALTMRRRPEII